MLRILAFFLVVLAAALGFNWLADNPGTVTFVWQGSRMETSMMVFLVALAVLVVAVLIVVALLRAFFKTPGAIGHWWRTRRRDNGYRALSSGIIAAGAGDAILARRMTKRSEKLLNVRKEPLVRFLDAQTAMIEGDHARARTAFEQMERDPETRLLALRGLFLEAERVGDEEAARHYAERAVRIAPHVPWAGGAVLETKSLAGDWNGALEVLEAQKNSRLVDRDESRRLRAVLLTAKAMTLASGSPHEAKNAGVEAHKLAPDLTPAALVAAEALVRLGDQRKAGKILEDAFKRNPHPDLAEAYVHLRSGDTTEDRLKRARKLHGLHEGDVDAETCLARAALDAGDLPLARKAAMAAVKAERRESGYLLLADIEEAETGEVGRVREWLARAIRARRDPAWTADGIVSRRWAPISPISGRLDAFEWKVPVEDLADDEAPVLEAGGEENAARVETMAVPSLKTHPKRERAAEIADHGETASGRQADEPAPKDVSVGTNGVDGSEKRETAGNPESAVKPESDQEPATPPQGGDEKPRGYFRRRGLETGPITLNPEATRDDSSATTTEERGYGPSSEKRKEARFG